VPEQWNQRFNIQGGGISMKRLSFQKAKGMWVGFFDTFDAAVEWLISSRKADSEDPNNQPEQQILTEKFFKGKCLFLETTREERDKCLGKIDFTEERRYCSKCGYWLREYDLNKTDECEINEAGEYTCQGYNFGKKPPHCLEREVKIIKKALKEDIAIPQNILKYYPELVKKVKKEYLSA